MADASLFFKDSPTYGIGEIIFDLVLSESHDFSNLITTHPVEDGSEISDHIYNNIESGKINGLVTNYSINSQGLEGDRSQDVFDALVELWRSRTLVTITTILRTYKKVAITDMPFMKDASHGLSLPISISFKKVKVVKLQSIDLTLAVKPLADGEDLLTSGETPRQVTDTADVGETVTEKPAATKDIPGNGYSVGAGVITF